MDFEDKVKPVYTENDLPRSELPIKWSLFTVIILAAGKGTRLGYDRPKILYPVAGRPILEWLVALFSGICVKYVFVLSPEKVNEVDTILRKTVSGPYDIAVQPEPIGMGDAILRGLEFVETEFAVAIWGDQVGIRRETVTATMYVHEQRPNAVFTCPTIFKKNPYIHFQRDKRGKIAKILQAREGDTMPIRGECDCGFFIFEAGLMCKRLTESRNDPTMIGRKTGEFNFLPVIPSLDCIHGNVAVVRTVREEETIGINTKEEAEIVARFLLARDEALLT